MLANLRQTSSVMDTMTGASDRANAPKHDPAVIDRLLERMNDPQAVTDDDFNFWPEDLFGFDDGSDFLSDDNPNSNQALGGGNGNNGSSNAGPGSDGARASLASFRRTSSAVEHDYDAGGEPMPAISDRGVEDIVGDGQGPNLLSRMLNPDAGGKGCNRNGLMGLLATTERPEDPRERLRQKMNGMRRNRSTMRDEDVVRDERGRKVVGARNLTQEDMQMGLVPARLRQNVDREATKRQIRKNILALRGERALNATVPGSRASAVANQTVSAGV